MSNHQTLLDVRRRSLAAGFYAAGESLAVDFVDTIKLKASPVIDLLDGRHESFWHAHQPLLPPVEAIPEREAVNELREAVRSVLEAVIDGVPAASEMVRRMNEAAASSLPVSAIEQTPTGQSLVVRSVGSGDPLLAAVARSAVLAFSQAHELRRCGSPRCSMLYLSHSTARLWCSHTCGNRMRVQRSTRAS